MYRNTSQPVAAIDAPSREGAMSFLLTSLMALIIAEQLFALPLSLGAGLSLENAMLYVVAGGLVFRVAVQRSTFRFELRSLHACFAVVLLYAACSIPMAALMAPYQGYDVVRAILAYKSRMFDQFVYFAVFFYGIQNSRGAFTVLKALLLMTAMANLIALLDAWGFVQAAGLVARGDGRAQGVMGESNQSAAFAASFLPGLAVLVFATRGLQRLMWLGAVAISAVAMMISASRGGFLAIIIATLWGVVHFRHYLSARTLLTAALVVAALFAAVLPIVASQYGWLLENRIVQDSVSGGWVGVSSGRVDIWSGALAVMAKSPLSFLTGFGWGAYDAMPFRYAPHNHYLRLWFDLGLLCLIAGTALLVIALRTAAQAVAFLAGTYRPVVAAFAVGALAISIAAFFVDLYTPWLWFWAYAGLALRIAINSNTGDAASAAKIPNTSAPSTVNTFGWVAAGRR
jgi:O-antigen ligase